MFHLFWNRLKREENWLSLNVSAVSKRFKTNWNKTLEKMKIPGPIAGVSKNWKKVRIELFWVNID